MKDEKKWWDSISNNYKWSCHYHYVEKEDPDVKYLKDITPDMINRYYKGEKSRKLGWLSIKN